MALAVSNGAFKPQPVIDRLRGLTSHLPWFSVAPRLVVSSFSDVGRRMTTDAAMLDHPVIDAVAGNPAARERIESAYNPVQAMGQDSRPPATDVLLLDADPEQENVVAQIAAGNSLVVKTLPGTGGTQTIVNALGTLIGQHKRVLVVSARRASLEGIAHRLGQVGLPGVAVSARTLRRDLILSIGRNEKAERARRSSDVDDALVRLRKVLLDYRGALTRRDPALRRLGARRPRRAHPAVAAAAPRRQRRRGSTTRRSSPSRQPRRCRSRASSRPRRSASSATGRATRPGTARRSRRPQEADTAHALAKRLNTQELPRLIERANALIGQTRLRPFESIAELGIYLRLLLDIRETLDKFQPVGLRPVAGRADRRHVDPPRRRPRCPAPTVAGSRSWPTSTCGPACTSPT